MQSRAEPTAQAQTMPVSAPSSLRTSSDIGAHSQPSCRRSAALEVGSKRAFEWMAAARCAAESAARGRSRALGRLVSSPYHEQHVDTHHNLTYNTQTASRRPPRMVVSVGGRLLALRLWLPPLRVRARASYKFAELLSHGQSRLKSRGLAHGGGRRGVEERKAVAGGADADEGTVVSGASGRIDGAREVSVAHPPRIGPRSFAGALTHNAPPSVRYPTPQPRSIPDVTPSRRRSSAARREHDQG